MNINTLYKLKKDDKMHKYLRENSIWYKYLNRSDRNYEVFIKAMKKQYRLGFTDKMSDTFDNIELLSTAIESLK